MFALLKKNFIVAITIAIALATAVFGAWLITNVKEGVSAKLVADYERQEDLIATRVAMSVQKDIKEIENELMVMALAPEVIDLSEPACSKKMQEYFKVVGSHIGNLGRATKDGVFACSLNKALIGAKASAFGDYVQRLIDDPEHKTVMSRKVKPTGLTTYAAAVHVPVYDKAGQFAGTLGGAIYFDQIKDKNLKDVTFGTSGFAVLLDDNGDILYHPQSEFVGQNVHTEELRNLFLPRDALSGMVLRIKDKPQGSVHYEFEGHEKVAAFKAFDVPGRQMIAVVTVDVADIKSVLGNVGLDQAFVVTIVILTLSLTLLTLVTLTGLHRYAELERAKDEFVSLASHQLRTPLTSIRLFSEMLADGQTGKINKLQAAYVEKIQLSTERMISLVGDILNLSRIEVGRLVVMPMKTDLNVFVSSYIDAIRPVAAQKGAKLTYNAPQNLPMVNVDQTLFGQVVHNLLTNALRYTPAEKGVIQVNLDLKPEGYLLRVADNGIGIPKDQQAKIFKRFYRADNAKRAVGEGTGLGLYLVKMIMDNCGGRVWFESSGRGTTLFVLIPRMGMKPKTSKHGPR